MILIELVTLQAHRYYKRMKELDFIRKYYDHDDPSHDWSHIMRVVNLCQIMGELYHANMKILVAAAYLHDIVNIPKNSEKRSDASFLAAQKTKKLLIDQDFSEDEINEVAQIVLEHSFSANLKATSIESEILQDADKLDSIGAIGIMRWATVGTLIKAKYYHLDDPKAQNRQLDDKSYSLDHFEVKLLKIYDRLNTDWAKAEGLKRMNFMKSFLSQLDCEIS